jgi:ABC-type sugar transport system permease subunit
MVARRWVIAATAVAAAGGAATVGVARWAEGRFERAGALRIAATTAAYLAVVVPAGADSSDFDLAKLLVQARALTTLPGRTSAVEVYHGTAPLVDATAAPLPAAELASLRREAGGRWQDGRALMPLIDPGCREVVGAVAIRVVRGRSVGDAAAQLLRWAFPAALLAVVVAAGAAAGRRPPGHYTVAALLLGLAAYADVRGAARRVTDRWLAETRLLLQEAATRLPTPRTRVALSVLAPLAAAEGTGAGRGGGRGNADLVEADSTTPTPRRVRVAGAPYAVVAARLGAGRWVEVRAAPAEASTAGWLLLLTGLALCGPLALRGLRWVELAAHRRQELRETATAWAFLAPAGLHLALFSFGPTLYTLYLSMHAGGFANFAAVLRDRLLWISLRNTVVYSLYVPVSMAIALVIALLLNRAGGGARRAVRLLRAAFFLPCVASVVGAALVWQWMYHPDFGLVNYLLSLVGAGPYDWLGRPRTALIALMLLSIWAQVGYQMAVFLAGLEGIPQAYLDAARVDGATAWQRFRRITLPLLRPVLLFVLVTGVIGAFQLFTYVYVLTRGGPLHATETVVYRIYQTSWEFLQFGSASALSVCLFALLFGATWLQFKLLGRAVEYA